MKTYSKPQNVRKFSLKLGMRQEVLLPPLVFSIDHWAGDSGWCNDMERKRGRNKEERKEERREKERKSMNIRKKEKSILYTDLTIVYIQNPKELSYSNS